MNLIVGILWHEFQWPVSQQPATRSDAGAGVGMLIVLGLYGFWFDGLMVLWFYVFVWLYGFMV